VSRRRVIAAIAGAVVAAAVVGAVVRSDPEPPDLLGRWQLVAIEPVPDTFTLTSEYTLELTEDRRWHAQDRCNQLYGTWDQDGRVIVFRDHHATLIGCQPPEDDVFHGSWSEARVHDDGRLVVTGSGPDLVYERTGD
jgi:heat shock protein HslJ